MTLLRFQTHTRHQSIDMNFTCLSLLFWANVTLNILFIIHGFEGWYYSDPSLRLVLPIISRPRLSISSTQRRMMIGTRLLVFVAMVIEVAMPPGTPPVRFSLFTTVSSSVPNIPVDSQNHKIRWLFPGKMTNILLGLQSAHKQKAGFYNTILYNPSFNSGLYKPPSVKYIYKIILQERQ